MYTLRDDDGTQQSLRPAARAANTYAHAVVAGEAGDGNTSSSAGLKAKKKKLNLAIPRFLF